MIIEQGICRLSDSDQVRLVEKSGTISLGRYRFRIWPLDLER